jgi:Flp pilus assembly protein TadB
MDVVLIFLVFSLVAIVLWIRSTRKSVDQASGKLARPGDSPCPRCKEFIKSDAEVCRHCAADLSAEVRERNRVLLEQQSTSRKVDADPSVRTFSRLFFAVGLPCLVVFGNVSAFLLFYPSVWILPSIALAVVPFWVLNSLKARARRRAWERIKSEVV